MATAEALRVATEVARALEYAHGQGVVHRDLKPSNVFLCGGGLVKVLDFGMAHAFGLERISGGTPSYMAPEQARGAPEDERTDVFALGVILYRMLTGLRSGMAAISRPRAPPPPRLAGGARAGVVRGAQQRRIGDAPARGRSSPRSPRSGSWADWSTGTVARVQRRRRRLWGVAALLAAGAILGAGAAALVSRRSLAPPKGSDMPCVAVLPLTSLSASQDDRFFAEGIHGELITQLAKISRLRVIARSSVQQYRDGARDLGAISRTLGAGTILGHRQRDGARAHRGQLVDPRTGRNLGRPVRPRPGWHFAIRPRWRSRSPARWGPRSARPSGGSSSAPPRAIARRTTCTSAPSSTGNARWGSSPTTGWRRSSSPGRCSGIRRSRSPTPRSPS
jgi:TolB-like protein